MSELIEVARSSVQTWECDQMGHMNVQFYLERADQALAVFGNAMGLGPRVLAERGQRLAVAEHHVRFLREQRPGAPFYILAGIVQHSATGFTLYEEMRNTLSHDPAATFVADVELQDRKTGAPVALPDAPVLAADRQIDLPAHGAPRGLDMEVPRAPLSLEEAEGLGMVTIFRGQVTPAQVDVEGRFARRQAMGVISDGIPNLLAQIRGDDRSKNPSEGGAALEYRFVYREPLHVGDLIVVMSALKEVKEKTYTWCHWMFDGESGKAVASAEAVAIALDLETRKVIPIPDGMRGMLEKKVIAGLSA